VGSLAPATAGTVNSIGDSSGDWLLIDTGSESSQDVLNVDDTGDTQSNSGKLTSNTLTGLDMSAGIEYYDVEVLNISLGTGADDFYIESTHTAETNLNTGDGASTVGTAVDTSRSVWDLATWTADDVVDINTISGLTNVDGQAGNDFINVNVDQNGDRTDVNGIGAILNLDGNGDNDTYTLNFAGSVGRCPD
jgi:hypothetical protein